MPASDAIKLLKHYESEAIRANRLMRREVPSEHIESIRKFLMVAAPHLIEWTYFNKPDDGELYVVTLMRGLRREGFNL